MTDPRLYLSSSPHVGAPDSVSSIMGNVVLALVPSIVASVIFFGMHALAVTVVCVITCVATEALCTRLSGRVQTVGDLSAVVTGILLAFNLPPSVPLWLPVIGGVFAIGVVKFLFGGIGQNIVNPALAARAALLASWPALMTRWTLDGVSTATPLALLKHVPGGALPSFWSLFAGHVGGCLGETSALALLIGGAWLLYKKIISWHIPVVYLATVLVLTTLLGRHGFFTGNGIYELFAGGLMLGAFFMATDYTTSPFTKNGQMIFAAGCGVLTTVIRLYGGYTEGVSYSILIMNLFTPMIDRFMTPHVFGEVKH
ncbi:MULTISPECIES: RnfABCDGE type electron transport complex subunit D [Jonquetella]|uniref:Ion-translocating oxidoreductase complex subunit D n=1 Tax=Jonquetella anthropi DSM 22815 TaxID=885272 RepID=H0UM82_9BACT|nr:MULTISPECIES: RnfABCDGE type electron transport complex subunit D [Jonquetella]EHM13658.1 putative NADH:ubiquinone oxidoreductase, subunit RnfD [Jonquetella anthropi DSM 22815]ERL24523.1 NQR2 and RnfD family protein [Jonquetella sp. BV3C21]